MKIYTEAEAAMFDDKISVSESTQTINERGEPLKREISDFIDSILEEREPMVNGREGKRNLEIAYEVLEMIG
ncbi:hypothetical protein AKJ57_01220 [candidate division MSBL1 archaeon SCGC-AAA259A05]|uniref:Gfo/Idh/MocA-like oxidoreductase C-terminal domain-containing protein n=1 Tax=candidate division MSBL1 archaeon SCGC-AAA259A05 TaxID=1698259 RepID=A0A133UB48_9EURY|nr:hypothetical protein AKJ57_01220 [candidate division MSBL1 archaeon SCGC-AAA259A05]